MCRDWSTPELSRLGVELRSQSYSDGSLSGGGGGTYRCGVQGTGGGGGGTGTVVGQSFYHH